MLYVRFFWYNHYNLGLDCCFLISVPLVSCIFILEQKSCFLAKYFINLGQITVVQYYSIIITVIGGVDTVSIGGVTWNIFLLIFMSTEYTVIAFYINYFQCHGLWHHAMRNHNNKVVLNIEITFCRYLQSSGTPSSRRCYGMCWRGMFMYSWDAHTSHSHLTSKRNTIDM